MFEFPKGLYVDLRVEDIHSTNIAYVLGEISQYTLRAYRAAFVRVFDGDRWYCKGLTDAEHLQATIDELAGLATPDTKIEKHPVIRALEVNQGEFRAFADEDLALVPMEEKNALIKGYIGAIAARPAVKSWTAKYLDRREIKHFISSLGADLIFDTQRCGAALQGQMAAEGDKTHFDLFSRAAVRFPELHGLENDIRSTFDRAEHFLENSCAVEPGTYPVILSPMAAGVFAHECFGHKSEADFMIGDESAATEWAIGKRIGAEILSIVDDGGVDGSGHVPFDDEGTRARRTDLIRNGVLAGRLHSAVTAAALGESVTGNSRAVGFSYEPIPRMTMTSIGPGELDKEELFSRVDDGIYVETIKHGSGMSTFTLAPNRAYRVVGGKIADPVKISVVTGEVFAALGDVVGLSDKVELQSFVGGGCGKMEQMNLPVGFGGPYVLVRSLDVR
ncbi:MAG: peptidase [Gemmatimonadetes bacterium]|nr:peptidase [Gemmatimonadota bacterium]